jgi:hypothetical protein
VILSGHAPLYQRFTRTSPNGKETPYIVSGSGGFSATMPKPIKAGTKVGDHTLVVAPIVDFGYLTIETDAQTLSATFKTANGITVTVRDSVTVDLKTGKITKSTTPSQASPAPHPGTTPKSGTKPKGGAKKPAKGKAKTRR